MADVLYELRQVTYSYLGKIPALCGVDLAIEKGSKIAVLGANGTGKSTLLAMLDALLFPDKGHISVFGRELSAHVLDNGDFSRFFRGRVGFVFQNPDVQLFSPTVREDIIFGPLHLGATQETIAKRLDRLTALLKIGPLLDRAPHQLSIGEKRKVAVASVLSIEPEVLLLDEPTAGLDPQTTRDIVDILLLENAAGKTIVTATQDLHIVEEISDVVHVFGAGKRIIRSGLSAEVLSDQDFLRAHNLIHIHRHRHANIIHTHPH